MRKYLDVEDLQANKKPRGAGLFAENVQIRAQLLGTVSLFGLQLIT
jgi:hypothetical protein